MTMLKMTMVAAALLALAGCGAESDGGARYSDYYGAGGPGSNGDPGYGSGVYFDGNGAGASLDADREYGGGIFYTGNDVGAAYYDNPTNSAGMSVNGNDAGNASLNADRDNEQWVDDSSGGNGIRR